MAKGQGRGLHTSQAPPPQNKDLKTDPASVRAAWKAPHGAPAPQNKNLKTDAAGVRSQWKSPTQSPAIPTKK